MQRHLLAQIASDGSQKMPIRVLPIVRAGCALGMPEYLDYEPDRLPLSTASVNREGRLCVQIGVLGTPREPFTSFQMIGLATILGWLQVNGVPITETVRIGTMMSPSLGGLQRLTTVLIMR